MTILCPTKPRGRIVEISHPTKLKYCDLQVFGEDDQLTCEFFSIFKKFEIYESESCQRQKIKIVSYLIVFKSAFPGL